MSKFFTWLFNALFPGYSEEHKAPAVNPPQKETQSNPKPQAPSGTTPAATPVANPIGSTAAPSPSLPAIGAPSLPTKPTPAPVIPGQLSRFEKAIRYVMENEDGKPWDRDDGCFTFNPNGHTDPPTKWGIIQEEYSTFLKRPVSVDEVKAMPRETAEAIYKHTFWDAIHGDDYASEAAAVAIMDCAVNKGLGGCMVILTDALHNHFDVRYGDSLIDAVDAMAEQAFLAAVDRATLNYIDARIEKYPNMAWARKGWDNRANRIPSIPTYLAGLK